MSHSADPLPGLPHDEVAGLLPWYVNGTLAEEERNRVDAHLAGCRACEAELARCRLLSAAVRMRETSSWEPSAAQFARLMGRIDAAGPRRWQASAWWRRTAQSTLTEIVPALWSASPPVRWVLAAQGAAIAVLVAVVVWQASPGPASYRTLSDGAPRPEAGRADLRVVFAPDMTERELRSLLEQVRGALVGGPSPTGAYTVQITGEAAARERISSALAILRAHSGVRLAEPASSQ